MTRFLALGDSYTIGEGVDEAGRWPVQLVRLLGEAGWSVEPPRIVATTGWTTDELAAALDRDPPRGPFDLVSLLIGVNDQYRGRGAEEYRPGFRALLHGAAEYAARDPGRVLVLSIPDWGTTPFAAGRDRGAIAAAIDVFNRVNREEADRAGARYLDVTTGTRETASDPGLTAADGLHPSALLYARWAGLALPAALDILTRPPSTS